MNVIRETKKNPKDIIFNVFIGISLIIILFFILFFPIRKYIHKRNIINSVTLNKRNQLYSLELNIANAVDNNNIREINTLLTENKEIIKNSFSGKQFYSILHYAVFTHNLKATEALLKCGYNPNVQDENGRTPLNDAVKFGTWYYDLEKYPSMAIEFVNLLLDYNANPDICDNEFETPLITSIICLIDKKEFSIPKLLMNKGKCNINITNKYGCSVANYCLANGEIYLAYFLIVEQNADVTKDFYSEKSPTFLLRYLVYPLDSEEYKLKSEIIDKLNKQGADYYNEPVPEVIKDKIKKLYPDSWEDYIKLY